MCFSKVGLAVGVAVCLLRRKTMAKKEEEQEVEMAKEGVEMAKMGEEVEVEMVKNEVEQEVEMAKMGVEVVKEEGAAQADMGNFERILLE